eukprot:4927210-Pyramimonas_sp.AAC.1
MERRKAYRLASRKRYQRPNISINTSPAHASSSRASLPTAGEKRATSGGSPAGAAGDFWAGSPNPTTGSRLVVRQGVSIRCA